MVNFRGKTRDWGKLREAGETLQAPGLNSNIEIRNPKQIRFSKTLSRETISFLDFGFV